MKNILRYILPVLVCAALIVVGAGCDGGGGGGSSKPDVGDNDINTVLCIGDSITEGDCAPAGAPYPSRLAEFSGKHVINAGACGETSLGGASRIRTLLSRHKPGYVCILYGANDAGFHRDTSGTLANLRSIVQSCKANMSVPIIATMTPTYDSHAFARSELHRISEGVRVIAKEEGARLADLENEFGDTREFIQEDGLHPSDSGTALIALTFNDRI